MHLPCGTDALNCHMGTKKGPKCKLSEICKINYSKTHNLSCLNKAIMFFFNHISELNVSVLAVRVYKEVHVLLSANVTIGPLKHRSKDNI